MNLFTSLNYLFADINNDINNDESDILDLDDEIKAYFSLKSKYIRFIDTILLKKSASPKFEAHNNGLLIKNMKTNMPLEFIETPGCLTINIVDDITRKVLFQKKILTSQSIDINKRSDELKKLIKQNLIINANSSIQNKLNSLILTRQKLEIHKNNNLLSDEEAIQKINLISDKISELETEYNYFRRNFSKWLLELDILNSLRREEILKYDKTYYFKELNDTYLQIKSRQNFNNLIDNKFLIKDILKNFRIINAIQYQRDSTNIGAIAFNTDRNEYVILKEDINSQIQSVKVSDFDNITSVIPLKNIKLINGIYSKLDLKLAKSFFVSIIDINKKIKDAGFEPYYPEIVKEIKIENLGGKEEYYKKEGVAYLNSVSKINKEDTEIKLKPNITDNIEVSKSDTDKYDNLFDKNLNIRLVFTSNLIGNDSFKYPGNGYKESISLEIKKNMMFDNLYNTPNWRKILSNSYLERESKTGKIIPIIIDKMQFATIEHYLMFKKYYNKPNIYGEKLEQYNNYAMKFVLPKNSYDSYAEDDADIILNIEYLGYEQRDDWDKIKNDELIKALFAKFTQHLNLKPALLNTKYSLLMQYNSNTNELEIAVNHMKVRLMITKGEIPDNYKNANEDKTEFYRVYDKIIRPESKLPSITTSPQIKEQKDKNKLEGYYWLSIYDNEGSGYDVAIKFNDLDIQALGFYDENSNKIQYFSDSGLDEETLENLFDIIMQSIDGLTKDDLRLKEIDYYLNKKKNVVFVKKDDIDITVGIMKNIDGIEFIDFN